ncbi:MAG: CPBP family glutamic-type intramembrane protease [Thermoguttaceae bacterium]
MVKMTADSRNTPTRPPAEQYWAESRRPLASLAFIAPLLVVYEAGVLGLGAQNGADALMRSLLSLLGLGHFVLPVLTVCILLAWQHLSHQPWRVSGRVVWGMAAESVALGLCLCLVCLLWKPPSMSIGETLRNHAGQFVALLGAGIYEELLFRLILLSLMAWTLRRAGLPPRATVIAAVLANSLVFAAAHYVGSHGDPFRWYTFTFRSLAGAFFSVVFIYRGFGIAAGSHAAYDVLVTLL